MNKNPDLIINLKIKEDKEHVAEDASSFAEVS